MSTEILSLPSFLEQEFQELLPGWVPNANNQDTDILQFLLSSDPVNHQDSSPMVRSLIRFRSLSFDSNPSFLFF